MAAISAAMICLVAFSGSLGALGAVQVKMTTNGPIIVVSTNLPITAAPTPDSVTPVQVSAKISDSAGAAALLQGGNPRVLMNLTTPNGTQVQDKA